jgi:hypothetical protein
MALPPSCAAALPASSKTPAQTIQAMFMADLKHRRAAAQTR